MDHELITTVCIIFCLYRKSCTTRGLHLLHTDPESVSLAMSCMRHIIPLNYINPCIRMRGYMEA